jgi:hypothetical protein
MPVDKLLTLTIYPSAIYLGLDVEGIFRINGGEKEVIAICEEFERAPTEVHDFSTMNIHTLPSVIKKYLGSLPEPVIPNQFSTVFMEVVGKLTIQNYKFTSTHGIH